MMAADTSTWIAFLEARGRDFYAFAESAELNLVIKPGLA
jgi:hypothetical protein